MARTAVAAVVLACCLVLAGCAGAGSGGGGDGPDGAAATGGDDAMDGAAPAMENGAGDGGSSGGGSTGDADGASNPTELSDPAARRALVRTGTVVLETEAFDATRSSLVATARGMGGYVGDSTQERHREGNRTWTTGQVVLRVPAGRFSELLSAVRAEGTVVSERTQTEDVGDRLVDLEARLENLRAKRDRLRAFYERANATEELLAVEERLSTVQGNIERLKARKRSLEERVAYSTLTVRIREPEPDPEPRETGDDSTAFHQRSVLGAFLDSVGALVVFLRGTVVAAAYVAPFGLAVLLPVGAVGVVAWRRSEG